MTKEVELRIKTQLSIEMSKFKFAKNSFEKWRQLERLHILGQLLIWYHYHIHFLMLELAFQERKMFELLGQIFRIILILPGHLLGQLPIGNIGTTRVSAFEKMAIPEDLKPIFQHSKNLNE